MRKILRWLGILGCVGLSLILIALGRWYYIEYLTNPYLSDPAWPELTSVAVDESSMPISCRENVHVSHQYPDAQHYEVVIAGGRTPDSPMCIASMYNHDETHFVRCFVSQDHGRSWVGEFDMLPRRGKKVDDPTVEIDDDGAVYLVTMDTIDGQRKQGGLELATRNPSSGRWSTQPLFNSFLDRPWITLNPSDSDSAAMYVLGQSDEASLLTIDQGDRTLKGMSSTHLGLISSRPTRALAWEGIKPVAILANVNPIWGGRIRRTIPQILQLELVGDSLEPRGKIGGEWRYSRGNPSSAYHTLFPAAACYSNATRFGDHGYCVWAASLSSHADDECLLVSRTIDRGQTWELASLLSEQDLEAAPESRYLSFMPEVAVNKDGVVGVLWYDRRGMAPCTVQANQEWFVGQNVRFRASVDGGISWLPSIQVNSVETIATYNLGHTLGISTDAEGNFHAAWVDGRTGASQVWTAKIEVNNR